MRVREFWRDIPGTNGKYQASRAGEIRHVWPSGKTTLLKPFLHNGKRKAHKYRRYVHLRIDGKDKEYSVLTLVASAWKGPPPPGKVWHHRNGNTWDNSVGNIEAISMRQLGHIYGGRATRRSVEMIDPDGNVVELYPSAAAAARANHISDQAVSERCNGKLKHPFARLGYSFRYEDGKTGRPKKTKP